MQGGSILALSPSFNSYSSSRFAEIAVKVSREFSQQREELGLEVPDLNHEESFKDRSEEREEEEFGVVEVKSAEEEEFGVVEVKSAEEEEVVEEEEKQEEREVEEEGDEEESDDFEFAVVCRDADALPISADEIFANGQIRPIYPVFDRNLLFKGVKEDDSKPGDAQVVRLPLGKLLMEERDPPSSSSSEADELERIPPGTYCVWTPKSTPERCKKSNSTGTSKRWRFRDFLLRSNSDGKDTFVFLSPSSTKAKKIDDKTQKIEKPAVPKIRRSSGEVRVAGKLKAKGVAVDAAPMSAHEIHYVRNRALKEGDRRRSYLPYRQDLVGLFANVNGLSRNLHPF